jgi:hypothetical protein
MVADGGDVLRWDDSIEASMEATEDATSTLPKGASSPAVAVAVAAAVTVALVVAVAGDVDDLSGRWGASNMSSAFGTLIGATGASAGADDVDGSASFDADASTGTDAGTAGGRAGR